jgi:hypothetical protein
MRSSVSSSALWRWIVPAFVLIAGAAGSARAEISIAGSAAFAGDEWGYGNETYALDLAHETETAGQELGLRWHRYALADDLHGILPFEGHEPAARLGAHVLHELWWLSASAGLQGTLDFDGVTAELIVARAFEASSASTLTPRVELAREPLALNPLPLSLGLHSHRALAALALRVKDVLLAEGGLRADFWEGDTIEGRTRNSARDRIEPNRITTGYAYVLSDAEGWFDAGLAGKIASAAENTLLVTQLQPERRYGWYPASAPPFAWETSLILRAAGALAGPLHGSLQLQLPLLSQETRQWDALQATAWGTAPYEAKLELEWFFLSATSLQLAAAIFIKPWADWDALGSGAYRYASLQLGVEQRI